MFWDVLALIPLFAAFCGTRIQMLDALEASQFDLPTSRLSLIPTTSGGDEWQRARELFSALGRNDFESELPSASLRAQRTAQGWNWLFLAATLGFVMQSLHIALELGWLPGGVLFGLWFAATGAVLGGASRTLREGAWWKPSRFPQKDDYKEGTTWTHRLIGRVMYAMGTDLRGEPRYVERYVLPRIRWLEHEIGQCRWPDWLAVRLVAGGQHSVVLLALDEREPWSVPRIETLKATLKSFGLHPASPTEGQYMVEVATNRGSDLFHDYSPGAHALIVELCAPDTLVEAASVVDQVLLSLDKTNEG